MIRAIRRRWQKRWERLYRPNRWHLMLDLFLILIMIFLGAASAALWLYKPNLPWILFQDVQHQAQEISHPQIVLELNFEKDSFLPGQAWSGDIQVSNVGLAPAENLQIEIFLVADGFSLAKSAEAAGQESIVLDFGRLEAKSEASSSLQLFFSPLSDAVRLDWAAKATWQDRGQAVSREFPLSSLSLERRLSVSAAAYYNSPLGDQLGSGPLPPLVGLPTTYWIFVEASANAAFSNLVISGRLPEGVELTGQRSLLAGEFEYSPGSRQFVWQVPSLQREADGLRLGFEVELIPGLEQAGKIPPLIEGLGYYAFDAAGQEHSRQIGSLNSNLAFDRINQGRGRVEELK